VVHFHLDLTAPHQHLVSVNLRLQPRHPLLRISLPVWTPGSYLVRDYVRHLEQLSAEQNGNAVELRRLTPSCWQLRVDPAGGELLIRYRVMATELSVRTCHVDGDHAFLALAAVALEVEGERWQPHRLSCSLPADWEPFIPLPRDSEGDWWARDFDQLLDTPVELGPHRAHGFVVGGVPHRWVTWGGRPGAGDWLLERVPSLLADVARVCEACCRLMGVSRPAAESYLFVLHLLDEGYGGLEHDDSTVLVYGRRNFEKANGYRKFLQLVAHEYLHQWNVRRLRPAELTPINYHQPAIIPSLWFAEGVTSYVDQLLPLAAGLSQLDDLLVDLGDDLSRYLLTPGRHVQSLRSSSQEAWVKLYRADAYAGDSQVSYYLKGAVVALCLDLHLRSAGSSLALVLRALWQSHGRWGRGYSEADLRDAFAREAEDLGDLLPQWLLQHDDPDLNGYLRGVGLVLQPVLAGHAWAGFSCRSEANGLIAHRVVRDGPAEAAGLMVGDELIALDGERLRNSDQVPHLLRSGVVQELLVARHSQLRSLALHCQPPAIERYQLVRDPDATPEALERQCRWLALSEAPW
jgi:predicted metalloprotease with PDZ domain